MTVRVLIDKPERRPHCPRTPQKIKFLTAYDALTSRYARKFPTLHSYHCTACGYHHLTSQQPEETDR